MQLSKNFKEKKVTYNTIIEVNDESYDFIPYWDLAMKNHLGNNFITVWSENNKSTLKSLSSLFIKLIDKKEEFSPDKGDAIQSDKLFVIDVYRIKKEKEINNDFVKKYKQHNPNNLNIILFNIDEFKESTIKNINKIIEKIKYKTGFSDFSFIPYNQQNYGKVFAIIDNFFLNFRDKIAQEFKAQLKLYSDKINEAKDIYNKDENEVYEYLKNKVLYLDLLTQGEFWDDIKKTCIIDLFKVFIALEIKYEYNHITSFADVNILKIKQKIKSKKLSNVEYQILLIYYCVKSCRHLREYSTMKNILCNSSFNLDLYASFFKSIYHFMFWKINFVFNYINYLNALQDIMIKKDFNNQNYIEPAVIHLYTICYKNMKIYANKIKIDLPSTKILIFLKECVDKGINIKDELDKIVSKDLGDFEKDETFCEFKNDIKAINENSKSKKNIYNIFTSKKSFLEEYLNILQVLNKKNCDFLNITTSIRAAFEIIPLLISLNKFEEAKNFLNALFNQNRFKCNKWHYTHEFICLIFVMLLNCLEKNKENLNLMFKLLDMNFSKLKYFLNVLGSNDENLINDIISKYIESYSEIETDNKEDKLDKTFSLDKALDINLEKRKDNIIFINKSKTKKEQIKYKFTNNTGISVNVDKIQLIFEEFASANNKNKKEKESEEEKKQIIYEINSNSNTFKSITPFVKDQENIFDLIVDESNDIFQLNTMYKFKQIKYIIKNSLCGLYHIKEDMKICINSIDMKISTQIYPSYDASDYSNDIRNFFYYNVLSKIEINLSEVPNPSDLENKSLKFIIEDLNKKHETILIIQTQVLKEKLVEKYPDVVIGDSSIEFPPGSLKDKEPLENLAIPFYVENTNFYNSDSISMKITVYILDKTDDKATYTFISYHNFNLIHLFNMGQKFRLLNTNSYLMQSTFSLNIVANNIKVYTHNSTGYSFYIDTTQAINLVLLLSNKDEEIINNLRKHFLEFSIDETKEGEAKITKYRLCYPENKILEEIKELKDIPYHIIIDVDDCQNDIFKEILVNITIKKYNKKKVVLLTHIRDNENWAIIGKSRLIEEWYDDKENEKHLKVQLLPLVDGFLKLPDIEFFEYEIQGETDEKKDKIDIGLNDENEESKEEEVVGKMTFDPIEFGAVIEGNNKVIRINPANECSLKLNLT